MTKLVVPSRVRGLPLGTTLPSPRTQQRPEPLVDAGDGHLITFAPTGAGKGVSCIIPALLSWDGAAIVIDPKGENYAVTAARRLALGQRVCLLDPFGVTGSTKPDSLNPLRLIDIKGPCAVDDAAVIANLIIQGAVFSRDPFWDLRASDLIIGLIILVLHSSPAAHRTLVEVRELLEATSEHQRLAHQLNGLANADARVAANILMLDVRVRGSIITTASSHMAFLRSGPVQKSTASSTIRLDDVTSGAPLTIYLVLPPDKLMSHGKLLRLWLGVLMTALSRRRFRPERPTLLLIDEAAQLGPLDELRVAVTLMRGYGVRCWSFWQDLSQLKRTYPHDWQSLVNNCAVQQYFGVSAPQAAAEIGAYLAGCSPRPLSQLKPHESLLIRRGEPPAIVTRPDYLRDRMFTGLYAPNPYFFPGTAETLSPVVDNVLPFRGRS